MRNVHKEITERILEQSEAANRDARRSQAYVEVEV
jgi:hypothetical protein